MSATQAQKDEARREFERLNAEAWAEAFKARVQAIQAANPGMSFHDAWYKAKRAEQAPEPTTLGGWANLIKAQNPGWTFERSWRHAEELVHGSTAEPLTQHPKIAEQMRKIKALEDDKTSAGAERHAKFLAEVHKLISKNTSMTSAEAINRVIREHPELWPSTATARHAALGATLVKCHLAVPLDGHLPTRIMFMPAGKTTICPSVNGSPKQISVNVTRQTANAFQTDLDKLLSRTVKPYIDFNHSGNEAAALPKRFVWVEGQGIFLDLDWTAAGRSAVTGRNWNYFSPTFLLSQTGEPIGLPETGSIGGLTNSPAFRDMKGISASSAIARR